MQAAATVAQASMQPPAQNVATAASAVVPQPSVPDPRALPPNAPPLGFDGYCPVSMRQHWKWVAGDPRYGVVHVGRTYWFASPNEQQQFLADPHRFSPALSGMDPVMAIDHRQQVPGKREHSIDYDNLFYMFSSEATLQQFAASPERYATSVRQAMGIQRGRLAR
jgi:protein disulfide-isomerase